MVKGNKKKRELHLEAKRSHFGSWGERKGGKKSPRKSEESLSSRNGKKAALTYLQKGR